MVIYNHRTPPTHHPRTHNEPNTDHVVLPVRHHLAYSCSPVSRAFTFPVRSFRTAPSSSSSSNRRCSSSCKAASLALRVVAVTAGVGSRSTASADRLPKLDACCDAVLATTGSPPSLGVSTPESLRAGSGRVPDGRHSCLCMSAAAVRMLLHCSMRGTADFAR
jgi:hypothetical protein